MPYEDLRHFIRDLEEYNLFRWVDAEVDKDWEISAVTRTYFRRVPKETRGALGFRNIKGWAGHRLVVGTVGGGVEVYHRALGIEGGGFDAVNRKWREALTRPIPAVLTDGDAPCQEVVRMGEEADLHRFPIPTWTPEKDPGPFLTSPCLVTKDRGTGVVNVGVYRLEVKGPRKTGVLWDLPSQHGAVHFAAYEAASEPMPMAVVLGVEPTILMGAVAKAPMGFDEFAIAGGLRGAAVELVKCKTVDLEVPARAEIILEGHVPPHVREREGPFGEYTGYMGGPYEMAVFEIDCITHRKDALHQAFFSQMPPSESSLIRAIPEEAHIYKHLAQDLRIPGIVDVHLPEAGGSYSICWVRMKQAYPGQAQQVLSAAWTHHPAFAKWIIVTDEDVDIRDPFQREWALAWRVQPHRDLFTIPNTAPVLLDPSAGHHGEGLWEKRGSKILIDATKPWPDFPDVSLPPQKYLDRVAEEWERYGLTDASEPAGESP